jgi:hypothetical protein
MAGCLFLLVVLLLSVSFGCSPLLLDLWNLALEGLGVLDLEGSRGLKLEEKAWMGLDRVVPNATYLEEKLRLGHRQVWILEGGGRRGGIWRFWILKLSLCISPYFTR